MEPNSWIRDSVARVAAAFCLASVASTHLAAQTIRGTVTDPASGAVVAEALVIMVNDDGEPVATVLTSADGSFAFSPPGPGGYMVGVTGLGYQQAITPRLEVGAADISLDSGLSVARITAGDHVSRTGTARSATLAVERYLVPFARNGRNLGVDWRESR